LDRRRWRRGTRKVEIYWHRKLDIVDRHVGRERRQGSSAYRRLNGGVEIGLAGTAHYQIVEHVARAIDAEPQHRPARLAALAGAGGIVLVAF
jgi:hypothetical protein